MDLGTWGRTKDRQTSSNSSTSSAQFAFIALFLAPRLATTLARSVWIITILVGSDQELMSHPKGGEGAFNYVVTALSKVLAVL